MENQRDVAGALELLLEAHELNPTSLANVINEIQGEKTTSQPQIRRILNRESKYPTDRTLGPLAEHFGLKTSELRDYDFVERMVNSGGTVNPTKQKLIREILNLLHRSSEEDCDAFFRLLDRKGEPVKNP